MVLIHDLQCCLCKRIYHVTRYPGDDKRFICFKCLPHIKGIGILILTEHHLGIHTTEDKLQRVITWLKYHDKWDEVNANIVADRLEGQ